MVDVGAEYEAAPIPSLSFTPMAKEAGFLVFLEYSGLAASLVYTDTSTREIDPSAMVMQEPPGVGDEGDPVFWPTDGETVHPEYLQQYISGSKYPGYGPDEGQQNLIVEACLTIRINSLVSAWFLHYYRGPAGNTMLSLTGLITGRS